MNWKWPWPDLSYCPLIHLQLPRKIITLSLQSLSPDPELKSRPPQEKQQQCQTFVEATGCGWRYWDLWRLAVGGTVQEGGWVVASETIHPYIHTYYIHTDTHTHIHTHIYTYIHNHTFLRTYIHTYIQTHAYTYIHTHTYTHTYITYTHTHRNTHIVYLSLLSQSYAVKSSGSRSALSSTHSQQCVTFSHPTRQTRWIHPNFAATDHSHCATVLIRNVGHNSSLASSAGQTGVQNQCSFWKCENNWSIRCIVNTCSAVHLKGRTDQRSLVHLFLQKWILSALVPTDVNS